MIRRRPCTAASSLRHKNRRLFLEGLENRDLLATLVSDKLDYAPGETALLTASGYQVGETVKFQVLHTDGTPNTGNGHDPWNVVDGGAGDLDGLANGNVKTTWFVDPDDSIGSVFEASALGLSSNLLATTTFTDAGPPPSPGQLNQWDPGAAPNLDWVTGNNDGPYFEGDTVPYYISFDHLVVGNVYQVTIGYDTTKSGKHAIDYLRSYNQTIAFPPAVDPAVDAGVAVDPTPDFINIPLDPNIPGGIQQAGQFKMYNGDMTATSGYTLSGTYAGDSTTTISITFTAQDDGVGGAETFVVLTWGGHIGTRADWGANNSAVSITGSPYHMRLISTFDITDPANPDDLGGGNQDRSLSAEAVIFPATITIIKDAQPNDPQDFAFTTTGTGLSNFTLDDDADPTLSNTQVFSVTNFDQKTITEAIVAGWNLTNIQIVESGTADSTFNVANRIATLNVQEGENITVTYTNVKQSSITVIKDAVPNDAQDFEFDPSANLQAANFFLDDDANATLSNTKAFNNLAAGAYTVQEINIPTGWVLTNITVSGASSFQIGADGDFDPGDTTVSVALVAGENVTITYTDTKQGSITVVKDAVPNDAQDFTFDPSDNLQLTNFLLDDDANATLSNTQAFNSLLPGTYTVQEISIPAGWSLTNIVVTGAVSSVVTIGADSDFDAGDSLVSVALVNGENVTITYTDTRQSSITVIKDAVPNDPQNFEFDPSANLQAANFFLDDDADATLSNQQVFNNLAAGAYTVQEVNIPAGWALTNITVSGASSFQIGADGDFDAGDTTVSIALVAGENVTITYTDVKLGSVTVVKDAIPNDAQDFTFDPSDNLQLTNFLLDDDANATLSNQQAFNNLVPGTYTVQEISIPAGWSLTNIVVTGAVSSVVTIGADSDFDAGDSLVTVALVNGENVTITYTDTKLGSVTVVKDAVPNDAQDFTFDPSDNLQLTNFLLDDDANATLSNQQAFNNLVPGTYTVQEISIPAGWSLTNIVVTGAVSSVVTIGADSDFDAGDSLVTVALVNGENVTITYTDTKLGSVTVVKDAVPNDAQDFTFDPSDNLQLTNFLLDDDANATLSNQQAFNNLLPGTYTVQEISIPAGWSLTNIVVTGAVSSVVTIGADSDFDAGDSLVTVALVNGENVTITYTDTKLGSVTVVKDAVPNDAQDFTFDPSDNLQLTNFLLDDDANATLSNQQAFNNLLPGTYTVQEISIPAGWSLTNIVVTGAVSSVVTIGADSDFDAGDSLVTVALVNGENVTITYTDTKLGSVTVVKDAIPNDAQDFTFDPSDNLQLTNFLLDDDANATLSNQQAFNNLLPGTYTVQEISIPAGWSLTNIVVTGAVSSVVTIGADSDFDAGDSLVTVALVNGENVTITYTDTKLGSVTVVKDAVPNDAQDFTFDPSDNLQLTNFLLDDDANATLSNQQAFNNLLPGTYTVQEISIPAGWSLTNIVVTGAVSSVVTIGADSDFDAGDSLVTVALVNGENVTITYTDTNLGSITVVKDAIPNDAQDFTFDPSDNLQVPNFFLDDDANATLSNQQAFPGLLPGTYTIQEISIPAGWALTNIVVTGAVSSVVTIGADSDFDTGDSLVTVALATGEHVTITYTDTKLGSVTVVKDAIPDDAQDFTFDPSDNLQVGNFLLDDDANPTLQNNKPFIDLLPGTYTVQEISIPAGWSLTNIFVIGAVNSVVTIGADSDFDAGDSLVTVALVNGENVTITYTDTKLGSVTVVKDAVPNDAQDFTFDPSDNLQLTNFLLDDDANATLSNQQAFNNLLPGTYTVQEISIPAGWSLTNIVVTGAVSSVVTIGADSDFDAGDSLVTVALVNGENVTITYTDTKLGSVTVVKDAVPNDAQDFTFDPSDNLQLTNFLLDDDADATLSNQQAFNSLLPGTYTVQEISIPAGWSLTNIVVTGAVSSVVTIGADSDFDAGDSLVTVALVNGENVTITYTDTKLSSITVVKDAVPNDAQDFTFDPSDNLQVGNFQLDDDGDPTLSNQQAFNNLAAGNYTVQEISIPAGWTLTNITVSGASSFLIGADGDFDAGDTTVSVALVEGENVTITYTDTKNPPIIVIGPDKTNCSLPYVHIFDTDSGTLVARFLAYEPDYLGGVRIATGDLTGDGIAEIITAPGRSHTPLVKIWDQDGNLLTSFLAFSSSFVGGVDIAVGDVNGDGLNDIAAAQSFLGNQVTVFRNTTVLPATTPTFATLGSFTPFGSFQGGVTVELADMGDTSGAAPGFDQTSFSQQRAEVIVGTKAGIAPAVKIFAYYGAATTPTLVKTFNPFTPAFHGGMSLDVARVNADLVPDIIVGAGNGGSSEVQILNGINGAVIGGFFAFTDLSDTPQAPVDVAARDDNFDGIADVILVAQGSDGTANEIRIFNAQTGAEIPPAIPESQFDSSFNGQTIDDFCGAYFVATLVDTPLPVIEVQIASTGLTASILPYGPTYFGGVSVATGDLNGDGIEEIVTGPEQNFAPWVRIFDQAGNMLHQFLAYASTFKGGVDVAVGDVNGDGKLDIATSMLSGGSQVKTFKNVIPLGATILPKTSFSAHSSFYPFGSSFKGGAVIDLADMGKAVTVSGVKKLDSTKFDNRAEVVVANGAGMRSTVKAFSYFGTSTTATLVRTFLPFNTTFKGGLSLDVARIDGDLVPDIIVGAGKGGQSQVQVLNGVTGGVISSFQAFTSQDTPSYNAKLDVEAQDADHDGIAEFLLAARDFDGKSREVRRFYALTGELVDSFFQNYSEI